MDEGFGVDSFAKRVIVLSNLTPEAGSHPERVSPIVTRHVIYKFTLNYNYLNLRLFLPFCL